MPFNGRSPSLGKADRSLRPAPSQLKGSPQVMIATWQIRPAGSGDAAHILSVSDEATLWLVDRGLSDQWGGEPPSSESAFVNRVSSWIRERQAVVAIDANGD